MRNAIKAKDITPIAQKITCIVPTLLRYFKANNSIINT